MDAFLDMLLPGLACRPRTSDTFEELEHEEVSQQEHEKVSQQEHKGSPLQFVRTFDYSSAGLAHDYHVHTFDVSQSFPECNYSWNSTNDYARHMQIINSTVKDWQGGRMDTVNARRLVKEQLLGLRSLGTIGARAQRLLDIRGIDSARRGELRVAVTELLHTSHSVDRLHEDISSNIGQADQTSVAREKATQCDSSRGIDFIRKSMPRRAESTFRPPACAGDVGKNEGIEAGSFACITNPSENVASRCETRPLLPGTGYPDERVAAKPVLAESQPVINLETSGKPSLPPGACDDRVAARRKMQRAQPCEWTLTIKQWRTVLCHCVRLPEYQRCKKQQGYVAMYDINKLFLRPWVEGTGCSLASLMNVGLEEPRPAKLMVCGSCGDDAEECIQALDRFVKKQGIDEDTPMWFSLFSCPVENSVAQPSIETLKSVIASPQLLKENGGHGVVALHTSKADFYGRLLSLYELDEALANKVLVRCGTSKEYVVQAVKKVDSLIKEGFPFEYCLERLTCVRSEEAKCNCEGKEKLLSCLNAKGGFPRLNRDLKDFRQRALPREVIQRLSSFCTAKRSS